MKQIGTRLNDDELAKLDTLCTIFKCSQNTLIRNLINAEYEKANGNKNVKKAIDALSKLAKALDQFNMDSKEINIESTSKH